MLPPRMAQRPPYRDVTVGQLLTRLSAALPDHEAVVYADRDLRWTFLDLERGARPGKIQKFRLREMHEAALKG